MSQSGAAGSVGSLQPHSTSGLGSVQSQELCPSQGVPCCWQCVHAHPFTLSCTTRNSPSKRCLKADKTCLTVPALQRSQDPKDICVSSSQILSVGASHLCYPAALVWRSRQG